METFPLSLLMPLRLKHFDLLLKILHRRLQKGYFGLRVAAVLPDRWVKEHRCRVEQRLTCVRNQDISVEQSIGERELGRPVSTSDRMSSALKRGSWAQRR